MAARRVIRGAHRMLHAGATTENVQVSGSAGATPEFALRPRAQALHPSTTRVIGLILQRGLPAQQADETIHQINKLLRAYSAGGPASTRAKDHIGVTDRFDCSQVLLYANAPKDYPLDLLHDELRRLSGIATVDVHADQIARGNRRLHSSQEHRWHMGMMSVTPWRAADLVPYEIDMLVVGSGIDPDHPEFHEEQVQELGPNGYLLPSPGRPGKGPDNYQLFEHETFVASLIAGRTCGVIPGHKLISVPLHGDGHCFPTAEITRAIEYIHLYLQKNPQRSAIVNMSLGGGGTDTVLLQRLREIQAVHGHRLLWVASAGNSKQPAHQVFPGTDTSLLLVGAVDQHGRECDFSCFGHRVDLFAPGEKVVGASAKTSKLCWDSGTSFAAPLVSGLALAIAQQHQLTDLHVVRSLLMLGSYAHKNKIELAERRKEDMGHFSPPLAQWRSPVH